VTEWGFNGHVWPFNPVCFMVLAAQSYSPSSDLVVPSASFQWDTDYMSGTANQITINSPGIYLVQYAVQFSSLGSSTGSPSYASATIRLNGVGNASGSISGYGWSQGPRIYQAGQLTLTNSILMSLSAGQYLQIAVASGLAATVGSSSASANGYLSAAYIGHT
jgi:hypothetical protein